MIFLFKILASIAVVPPPIILSNKVSPSLEYLKIKLRTTSGAQLPLQFEACVAHEPRQGNAHTVVHSISNSSGLSFKGSLTIS